jgi:hypothetical protein
MNIIADRKNIYSWNDKNVLECTLATNVLEASAQIYVNSEQRPE